MPVKIKAYECKFNCGKFLRTHSGMSKHEKSCWHDPDKKACISCGHNVEDSDDPGAYCEAFDKDLFDPKTGHPNLKHNCAEWMPKK